MLLSCLNATFQDKPRVLSSYVKRLKILHLFLRMLYWSLSFKVLKRKLLCFRRGLYVHQGLLHQNLQLILPYLPGSMFLMPSSHQFLAGLVPFLGHLVVGKLSLVKPFPSTLILILSFMLVVEKEETKWQSISMDIRPVFSRLCYPASFIEKPTIRKW